MSIKPGYPINKIFMIYFIIVYYVRGEKRNVSICGRPEND